MNDKEIDKINTKSEENTSTPDDAAGFLIRGMIKIFDPETNTVIVEKAD